jgi:hypothetical protein
MFNLDVVNLDTLLIWIIEYFILVKKKLVNSNELAYNVLE